MTVSGGWLGEIENYVKRESFATNFSESRWVPARGRVVLRSQRLAARGACRLQAQLPPVPLLLALERLVQIHCSGESGGRVEGELVLRREQVRWARSTVSRPSAPSRNAVRPGAGCARQARSRARRPPGWCVADAIGEGVLDFERGVGSRGGGFDQSRAGASVGCRRPRAGGRCRRSSAARWPRSTQRAWWCRPAPAVRGALTPHRPTGDPDTSG